MNTEEKLTNKNIRPTAMRILMYNFLVQQKAALSLSDIENNFENADRVTLYRTIKTFEERGLVHSIQENHNTLYKLCDDGCNENAHNDAHLHLYCKICGQTTCQEDLNLPNTIFTKFKIDDIQLIAKGVCEKCLNKTAS